MLNCKDCPYSGLYTLGIEEVKVEKPRPLLMIVGDIPTPLEARKKQCMTGPAVNILKDTLTKVGLPYQGGDVVYTTAVKCAYPKRSGKQIPVEVLKNCHKHIKEEILKVNPHVVLTLGKNATQTVLSDYKVKVTTLEGRIFQDTFYGTDIAIAPIKHPANIMRAPNEYKTFLSHLQLISNFLTAGALYDPGETTWEVIKTEEDANKLIDRIKQEKWKYVAADIETTNLDYRFAEFCVMGMSFYPGHAFVLPRELRHRAKDFFAIPELEWIWQHGKYDAKVMWRRGLGIIPHQHDVMYLHYVLDETSAHDLGYLSKTFLNAADYKYKMNQNFKAVTLDTYSSFFESLCERVAVDCDYTLQLYYVLWEKVSKDEPLKKLYLNLMMPATPFLEKVEQNGMLVNPTHLEEMGKAYEERLDGIMEDIHNIAAPFWDPILYMDEMGAKSAGSTFNPGSPKQMSWMVYKRLRLKPRIRKAGMPTGKEILESIEPKHPLIEKVLEYRKVKKELSTYVVGLLKRRDVDGRVRSNFSLHITATGRLSSKEPNVQNIPSYFGVGNVRRAFIAPKGKILMEVDYSGAELRWLACLSNCEVLTKIFVEGINLHDYTARGLYGENFTKQDRMRAKAANFGIMYGREAQSFKDEFNISMEEAQKIVDNWLNTYPGARDYLQTLANAVTSGKYIETPFGRRRRFGLVTEQTLHGLMNEARNFPIQSTSSDTLLYSAITLLDELHTIDVDVINLIHDSMLLEVPANVETIQKVSQLVSARMKGMPEQLFGYKVPFDSDTDIGFTWGDLSGYDNENNIVSYEKDGQKTKIPLSEWLVEEEKRVHDIYQQPWYADAEKQKVVIETFSEGDSDENC